MDKKGETERKKRGRQKGKRILFHFRSTDCSSIEVLLCSYPIRFPHCSFKQLSRLKFARFRQKGRIMHWNLSRRASWVTSLEGRTLFFFPFPSWTLPHMVPASPVCAENLHLISAERCFQFRIWVSRLTYEHLKNSMSPWHNVPQRPVGRQQRNGKWLAGYQWSKVLKGLRELMWEKEKG